MSISHYFFVPAVTVFFVLSLAISGDLMQGSLAAFVIGIGLCASAAVLAWRGSTITVSPLIFLIGALPILIAAASSWYAGLTTDMVFGSNMEWGTIASFCLFSVAFFAGSVVSRKVVTVFLWSVEMTGAAGALIVLGIVSGSAPATLIATSWMQLSFIFCAAVLVAAVRADESSTTIERGAHIVLGIASLAAFYVLLVPEAAVVAMIAVLGTEYAASRSIRAYFPYVSIGTALVILALLGFGLRTPIIPLAGDSRPPVHDTLFITGPEFLASYPRALIGTGPHTFSNMWNLHRAADENMTPLWRLTPKYSDSAFSTAALENGVLGMFALMIFLLIPLMYTFRHSGANDLLDAVPARALSTLALFLMLSVFVNPVGVPLLLTTALAVGMCMRSTAAAGIGVRGRYWAFVFASCVLAVGVVFVWVSYRQISAARLDARGLAAFDTGDTSRAISLLTAAVSTWDTSEYDQDVASAYLKAALSEQSTASAATVQNDMDAAAGFTGRAVQIDPRSYSRWLFRASVYFTLMQRGVDGAADKAKDALARAALLSPTRPEVPYARALIARAQGDTKEALVQLDKAIALKPDYEDALKLRIKITPVQ